jgi:hypothetical protein
MSIVFFSKLLLKRSILSSRGFGGLGFRRNNILIILLTIPGGYFKPTNQGGLDIRDMELVNKSLIISSA